MWRGLLTSDLKGRDDMYGYQNFTGTDGLLTNQYGMTHAGYVGMTTTGGTFDEMKSWLDKENTTLKVKNKFLVAGGLAAAVAYYGYRSGWFR